MTLVADLFTSIVGLDPHAATHTDTLVELPSGKLIGRRTFPTTSAGLSRVMTWIDRRAGGDIGRVLVSAEGAGSYGAIVAKRLSEAGYRVVETPTPSTKCLCGKIKSTPST